MSFNEGYAAGTTGMAKAIDTAHLIGRIQERKRIIQLLGQKICELNCPNHPGECYPMVIGLERIIQLIEETK
jgi:hypothetical protein